jgi:hypothetical protein
MEAGVADLRDLQFAGHPRLPVHNAVSAGSADSAGSAPKPPEGRRPLPVVAVEAREIEATVSALRCHPAYAAPASVLAGIRAIIDSGKYRVFDA